MKRLFEPVMRNYIAAGIWVALGYPTVVWWKESVLWVAGMSLYTIVNGHLNNAATHRARLVAEDGNSS